MRLARLLCCLTLFSPSVAGAEPLFVQSGAHPAFDRIVVAVPEGRQWRVRHSGDKAILTIDGHVDGFAVDRVFDRIPRDRVAAITRDRSELQLSLNCACDVAAFGAGVGFVAIDIADRGQTVVPPLQHETPPGTTTAAAVSAETPTRKERQSDATTVPDPLAFPVVSPRSETARTGLDADDPLSLPLRSAAEQSILNDVQERLVRDVGGATTRGMLTPESGGLQSVQDRLSAHQGEAQETKQPPTPTAPVAPPNRNGHLRVTSSMDIPLKHGNDSSLSISNGISCQDNEDLEVATWGDHTSFTSSLGAARRDLFNDRDHIDDDAALRLVKTYLYHGFGAEAAAILRMMPTPISNQESLQAIADIMEYGQARTPADLASQSGCDSEIALWAIMSAPEIPRGATVNTDAALRALNKLPLHLRKFLAPGLSNRFVTHGDNAAAAAALRSLERAPVPMSADGNFASARLELSDGETDAAIEAFEKVVDANAEPSPEALIALVDAQLARGNAISTETATLVEAYAHELRNTKLGSDLRRTHIMALLKSAQFDRAFSELDGLSDLDSNAEISTLRDLLLEELTATASDVVFLEYAFRQTDDVLATLAPETVMAMARRLRDTGFDSIAQNILSLVPERPHNSERQMLMAELSLQLAQPQRAIAALVFLDTPEADRLRADAKRIAGQHGEAHRLYAGLEATEDATRSAWMSKDWTALTPRDSPIFGPVAEMAERQFPADTVPDGMLGRSTAVLEESQAARDVLGALLRDPSLQLDGAQSP